MPLNTDEAKMVYIVGKTYILDTGYSTRGEVILLRAGKYFGTVEDPGNGAKWDVMLNRLSEV